MRVGDFGVEVVAAGNGEVREVDSGHVLARPGTVYKLRLRNHGPLRAVAEVSIDGKSVTRSRLVIDAYGVATLERPIDDSERGCFTVFAEGDERVFGVDGGRDNPDLGLIEVRFRRELPRATRAPDEPWPLRSVPSLPTPARPDTPSPTFVPPAPSRPMAPPGWTPPTFLASAAPGIQEDSSFSRAKAPPRDAIERAAGTGLTGQSSQEFTAVTVGPLEREETVVRLRLVIGTEEAFAAPRPLRDASEDEAPARPEPRP